MNEIRTLTMLELRALYGMNKFRYTKDEKAKNRYRLLGGVWIFLICMVFTYVGGLVYGLSYLGLSEIVPAYLVVIASLVIFAFGIFKAGNVIFGNKGYDILSSMPIKSSAIVVSRFLTMYVEDLILTLVIMLPGIAVYGVCHHPGAGFYLVALLGTLFVPAIPLVGSVVLGTLIMAISSRMKHKNMVQTVLMVALVVGILVSSFRMGNLTGDFTLEMLTALAQTVGELMEQLYLPAVWFGDAMSGYNLAGLLLFVAVSLGVMILTIWLVSRSYHSIMRRLLTFSARHNYKIGEMKSRGLLKALYFREAKRYFSSSIYVTNTIVGPIVGCIMSVALCVVGMETIQSVIPVAVDISGFVPFVFAAVFCMMTTTSTAISMEGKHFWVIQSLPIPAKVLLDSKILLNLSVMFPFYLVSEICLVIAMKPGLMQLVWLIFLPAMLMLLSVVWGITVNLKFHSFDWEKEEQVVKQSASAALGGFAGMLLSVLLGGLLFLVPEQYGDVARTVAGIGLLAGTAWLYRKNNRWELRGL